ncbi:hypothetical protein GVAV_000281 [Gurleya vavrai]
MIDDKNYNVLEFDHIDFYCNFKNLYDSKDKNDVQKGINVLNTEKKTKNKRLIDPLNKTFVEVHAANQINQEDKKEGKITEKKFSKREIKENINKKKLSNTEIKSTIKTTCDDQKKEKEFNISDENVPSKISLEPYFEDKAFNDTKKNPLQKTHIKTTKSKVIPKGLASSKNHLSNNNKKQSINGKKINVEKIIPCVFPSLSKNKSKSESDKQPKDSKSSESLFNESKQQECTGNLTKGAKAKTKQTVIINDLIDGKDFLCEDTKKSKLESQSQVQLKQKENFSSRIDYKSHQTRNKNIKKDSLKISPVVSPTSSKSSTPKQNKDILKKSSNFSKNLENSDSNLQYSEVLKSSLKIEKNEKFDFKTQNFNPNKNSNETLEHKKTSSYDDLSNMEIKFLRSEDLKLNLRETETDNQFSKDENNLNSYSAGQSSLNKIPINTDETKIPESNHTNFKMGNVLNDDKNLTNLGEKSSLDSSNVSLTNLLEIPLFNDPQEKIPSSPLTKPNASHNYNYNNSLSNCGESTTKGHKTKKLDSEFKDIINNPNDLLGFGLGQNSAVNHGQTHLNEIQKRKIFQKEDPKSQSCTSSKNREKKIGIVNCKPLQKQSANSLTKSIERNDITLIDSTINQSKKTIVSKIQHTEVRTIETQPLKTSENKHPISASTPQELPDPALGVVLNDLVYNPLQQNQIHSERQESDTNLVDSIQQNNQHKPSHSSGLDSKSVNEFDSQEIVFNNKLDKLLTNLFEPRKESKHVLEANQIKIKDFDFITVTSDKLKLINPNPNSVDPCKINSLNTQIKPNSSLNQKNKNQLIKTKEVLLDKFQEEKQNLDLQKQNLDLQQKILDLQQKILDLQQQNVDQNQLPKDNQKIMSPAQIEQLTELIALFVQFQNANSQICYNSINKMDKSYFHPSNIGVEDQPQISNCDNANIPGSVNLPFENAIDQIPYRNTYFHHQQAFLSQDFYYNNQQKLSYQQNYSNNNQQNLLGPQNLSYQQNNPIPQNLDCNIQYYQDIPIYTYDFNQVKYVGNYQNNLTTPQNAVDYHHQNYNTSKKEDQKSKKKFKDENKQNVSWYYENPQNHIDNQNLNYQQQGFENEENFFQQYNIPIRQKQNSTNLQNFSQHRENHNRPF